MGIHLSGRDDASRAIFEVPALAVELDGSIAALDDAGNHAEDVAMFESGKVYLENCTVGLPLRLRPDEDEILALYLDGVELHRSEQGYEIHQLLPSIGLSVYALARHDGRLASTKNKDRFGQEWWAAQRPPQGHDGALLDKRLTIKVLDPLAGALPSVAPLGPRSRASALAERRAA